MRGAAGGGPRHCYYHRRGSAANLQIGLICATGLFRRRLLPLPEPAARTTPTPARTTTTSVTSVPACRHELGRAAAPAKPDKPPTYMPGQGLLVWRPAYWADRWCV